jgi:hypothetical protein
LLEKLRGWHILAKKRNGAPNEYVYDVLRIAVFDAGNDQYFRGTSLLASLPMLKAPSLVEAAVMLSHQQHTVTPPGKL